VSRLRRLSAIGPSEGGRYKCKKRREDTRKKARNFIRAFFSFGDKEWGRAAGLKPRPSTLVLQLRAVDGLGFLDGLGLFDCDRDVDLGAFAEDAEVDRLAIAFVAELVAKFG
jgi:hypothetical protein